MPTGSILDVMTMLTLDDISLAYARIEPYIRRTPIMEVSAGTFGINHPLSLKLEFLQHAGTFKPRGAFNSMLSIAAPPAVGFCAASGGNHGIAVAHAAQALGHRAKIFVPVISSPVKVAAIRARGAEVVVEGERVADALALCQDYADKTGALSIHPYDSWPTMAGQGTVALEWLEQVGQLDTILVASGGGGLAAGMARAMNRRARLIAVEPEGASALHAALEAGGPVDVTVHSIAADSLGARNVFSRVYSVASAFLEQVVLVSDAAIRTAQQSLWSEMRIISEPGGATALAALQCGAYVPAKGERVGVLLCGANTELHAFS